jgi:two-component sensor histidine kinase
MRALFRFSWRESGGPASFGALQRRGFGSQLVQRGLAADFRGEVEMRYDPTG